MSGVKLSCMAPEVREKWMTARVKHGAYSNNSETALHYIWRSMLSRCYRKKDSSYAHYGARGIKVCTRWHRYENFAADMGPQPKKFTLDRIDNNGCYEPANCRWVNHSVQQKNKSSTRRYEQNGTVGTLLDWASYLGISKQLACWRMKVWGTFARGYQWHELPKK